LTSLTSGVHVALGIMETLGRHVDSCDEQVGSIAENGMGSLHIDKEKDKKDKERIELTV